MARRERMDPDTSRVVEERLQRLLRENGPTATAEARASRASDPVPDEDGIGPTTIPPKRIPRLPPSAGIASARAGAGAAVSGVFGSLRRPHVFIIAAIVGLGILLACWAVLRARPVAVAVTPPVVQTTASASGTPSEAGHGAPSSPDPSGSAAELVVHVLGAVKKPGIVRLPTGGRVQDALAKAGGLTGKADPGELNLAQPVADGQQIVVGTKSKPNGEVRDGTVGGGPSGSRGSGGATSPGGVPGGGSGGGSGGQQIVNLNTASQSQLEELPGVGPVMAGKIVAWRTENGRFSRVEELQEISGVGPKTYAKLAPLCRV